METAISSPSRPQDCLVRCQFSGGKSPHFSGLACVSKPFFSSCPLARQPTFSPVLPPQHLLRQHDFRASQGEHFGCALRGSVLSRGESSSGLTSRERLHHAQHCRGTSRSALKGKTLFCTGPARSQCPARNPQAPRSLTSWGRSCWTRRWGTYAGVWFHHAESLVETNATPSYNMLPRTLLNSIEDTAGLNPQRGLSLL